MADCFIGQHSKVIFDFSLYLKEKFSLLQKNQLATSLFHNVVCAKHLTPFPGHGDFTYRCWERGDTIMEEAAIPTPVNAVVTEKRSGLYFSHPSP